MGVAHLDCEPVPSSVRSARLFVVDKLQEWRCDDLVESAALLTSELATNAVVHTGQPFSVRVSRRGPGVRVEVEDHTRELPVPRELPDFLTPTSDDLYGPDAEIDRIFSGLRIVDATATAWGSDPIPGDGKVVWFEIDPPEGASDKARVSDLSDLRPDAGEEGLAGAHQGKVAGHRPSHQEAHTMGRQYIVDEDDRVIEERTYERRGGAGRVLLVLLVIAALAIGAWFLLGGSADVDTEGDLEVPEVDVDVNNPDVDVDSSEAPPASADAG